MKCFRLPKVTLACLRGDSKIQGYSARRRVGLSLGGAPLLCGGLQAWFKGGQRAPGRQTRREQRLVYRRLFKKKKSNIWSLEHLESGASSRRGAPSSPGGKPREEQDRHTLIIKMSDLTHSVLQSIQ